MAEIDTSPGDLSLCDPLPESPLPILARWFEEASASNAIRNHDAMALASVDEGGHAESIELWLSREGRLHDRALWTRGPDPKTWRVERLQP